MAYEQLIAGKLEALPLPDQADAIWARIEAQLDLELPTDNPTDGDTPQFPTGGFFIGGISLIILTALLALFSTSKNNTTPPSQINTRTPATQTEQSIPTQPPDVTTGTTKRGQTEKAPLIFEKEIAPAADSSVVATTPFPVLQDSLQPPVAIPPATANIMLDTPQKKRRGVTGISDADYRIVPKKDSTKN